MRYGIDYYKTDDLTPDELNAKRSNAAGLWLYAGDVDAADEREALAKARKSLAPRGEKVRINRHTFA
jgi:hypothetical protein